MAAGWRRLVAPNVTAAKYESKSLRIFKQCSFKIKKEIRVPCIRLEAIAIAIRAIAIRLETIAIRLEAIAIRLEYLDGGRGGCEVATAGSEVATLFAL